jgi:hypothetical protein
MPELRIIARRRRIAIILSVAGQPFVTHLSQPRYFFGRD